MKKLKKRLLPIILVLCISLGACSNSDNNSVLKSTQSKSEDANEKSNANSANSIENVAEFTDKPYVAVYDNIPNFSKEDYTTKSFETYSDLDELGRCGTAYANIGTDIMPTEKRGNIGQVKPSGWKTFKYDSVDGKFLYNRCHLIGYQLTGENANEKNLITGTRYMNVDGMLPFENMVADYVKETKNHVLYRVTPIYDGDNLVASGVQMEAFSVEDEGEGICYNVYVYNNQPGIEIDYSNGDSRLIEDGAEPNSKSKVTKEVKQSKKKEYVVNVNTKKFHLSSCSSVDTMKKSNKKVLKGKREDLISQGYEPCGICKP